MLRSGAGCVTATGVGCGKSAFQSRFKSCLQTLLFSFLLFFVLSGLGPLKVNAMRPLPVVDSRALRCAGPRPAMHFPNRTVGHAYRLGFAMPLDRCHNVTKASQYRQAF